MNQCVYIIKTKGNMLYIHFTISLTSRDATYPMGMAHVARVSTVVLYISLGYVHNTCFFASLCIYVYKHATYIII